MIVDFRLCPPFGGFLSVGMYADKAEYPARPQHGLAITVPTPDRAGTHAGRSS